MYDKFHLERNRIADANQDFFQGEILALSNELFNMGHSHPYNLSIADRKQLESKCKEYSKGGCNSKCKVELDKSMIHNEYLYRYSTLSSLANPQTSWKDSVIPIESAFSGIGEKADEGGWYNLGNVMTGFYKNARGFTWWTNEIPNSLNLLFNLGLVSDWLSKESVIMRLNKSAISSVLNKPSVIDAYDQPIFYPQSLNTTTPGVTLNLNSPPDYENGLSEFVIPEVGFSFIDVCLFSVDTKKKILLLSNIQKDLLTFYSSN